MKKLIVMVLLMVGAPAFAFYILLDNTDGKVAVVSDMKISLPGHTSVYVGTTTISELEFRGISLSSFVLEGGILKGQKLKWGFFKEEIK